MRAILPPQDVGLGQQDVGPAGLWPLRRSQEAKADRVEDESVGEFASRQVGADGFEGPPARPAAGAASDRVGSSPVRPWPGRAASSRGLESPVPVTPGGGGRLASPFHTSVPGYAGVKAAAAVDVPLRDGSEVRPRPLSRARAAGDISGIDLPRSGRPDRRRRPWRRPLTPIAPAVEINNPPRDQGADQA